MNVAEWEAAAAPDGSLLDGDAMRARVFRAVRTSVRISCGSQCCCRVWTLTPASWCGLSSLAALMLRTAQTAVRRAGSRSSERRLTLAAADHCEQVQV